MSDADAAFLGRGWSFPPTFERGTASVAMVEGVADIRESLWILLSTSPGERIMVPEYGCALWDYVFATLDTTVATQIAGLVEEAIVRWEPRVDVHDVSVRAVEPATGRVSIEIDYTVRAINTRDNLVFPFHLSEASIPAIAG